MTSGTKPNASLVLTEDELEYIRTHFAGSKSAAIHKALGAMMNTAQPYEFDETMLGSEATEEQAHQMVKLLTALGYNVRYGRNWTHNDAGNEIPQSVWDECAAQCDKELETMMNTETSLAGTLNAIPVWVRLIDSTADERSAFAGLLNLHRAEFVNGGWKLTVKNVDGQTMTADANQFVSAQG